MAYKKKLIEVALPLDAVNAEGARDKSLNRDHPKSLHWWWARRPLAVCRAIVFSQLVDDPSARPDLFPSENDQEQERLRLFDLIKQLVAWENSNDSRVLTAARSEIQRSMGDQLPVVIDPFCGGGSIPVEARRLGLASLGSDLNPVAALITKAMVDIPAPFEGEAPKNPQDSKSLAEQVWPRFSGLAADVRYYGGRLLNMARDEVGKLYEGDGDLKPGETPLAWLWARTVKCPNPGCFGTIPLVNSFSLSRTARRAEQLWAQPNRSKDGRWVRFEVVEGGTPPPGTVRRNSVRCLLCQGPTTVDYVKQEGSAGRMGRQLVATVVRGGGRRSFRAGSQPPSTSKDPPLGFLTESVPFHPQYLQLPRYGFTTFDDLYTPRQLLLIKALTEALPSVRADVMAVGAETEYADAVETYLAFLIDRIGARNSGFSFWDATSDKIQSATSANYMPMRWFFAEANPFATTSGSAQGQLEFLVGAISSLPSGPPGRAEQLDAVQADWPSGSAFSTDPPYYDNIPYADLSDFYYVILKRVLRTIYPDTFSTVLTPKSSELVADATRHGGHDKAAAFFRDGFKKAFDKMVTASHPDVPVVIYYALRQKETKAGELVATGWEQMLQSLIDADLQITATWPLHTEQRGGLRSHNRNALASSIVITARPRPTDSPLASFGEFRDGLRRELPNALRLLQQGNIAPVDLAQAAIGPGMAVFSRYSKVVEAGGTAMRVGTALGIINQVLTEVLSEQEEQYDPQTRWAVAWFEEHGIKEGPYGKAELLSKAKATALGAMSRDGFLRAKGNRVALVPRAELPEDWDPATDPVVTTWEATQHLTRALEQGGEQEAARLLRRLGPATGETARDLAYRLYVVCERRNWAEEALAYNSLVVAWPEIVRLAAGEPAEAQGNLLGQGR